MKIFGRSLLEALLKTKITSQLSSFWAMKTALNKKKKSGYRFLCKELLKPQHTTDIKILCLFCFFFKEGSVTATFLWIIYRAMSPSAGLLENCSVWTCLSYESPFRHCHKEKERETFSWLRSLNYLEKCLELMPFWGRGEWRVNYISCANTNVSIDIVTIYENELY